MKVEEIITDRILSMLEKGTIPWKQSWKGGSLPINYISKKTYQGVNVFLLCSLGYQSPYFLTYNQAKNLGGNVKQGEKGYPVIFWKILDIDKENPATHETKAEHIPMMRYYTVFNLSQCEGLNIPETENLQEFNSIQACENILAGMPYKPEVKYEQTRAFYHPKLDYVNMPKPESFVQPEYYYSVFFHELTHSTGHSSRLDRVGITAEKGFGTEVYSQEELVAEMGACFLAAHTQIDQITIEDSAAYIAGWLKKLRDDKKCVIMAAAQAQKAVNFIMNIQKDKEG